MLLTESELKCIGFWSTIAADFGEDTSAFKAAALKDLEVISVVAGLQMLIAFAALTVDIGAKAQGGYTAPGQYAYLLCVFLSIALSTVSA